MASNLNMITKLQKEAAREQILARWDIKIPAGRLKRMTLAQLQGIIKVMSGGEKET